MRPATDVNIQVTLGRKKVPTPSLGRLLAMICYKKEFKAKSVKGEGAWSKVWEGTKPRCPGVLSQSDRMCLLILPTVNYDNTREVLSTREAYWRHSTQGFYWTVRVGTFWLICPRIPDSGQKAGVPRKLHCLDRV